jgi:hypothetical protein
MIIRFNIRISVYCRLKDSLRCNVVEYMVSLVQQLPEVAAPAESCSKQQEEAGIGSVL